jgi:Fe2+ transport system protein FeoA
MGSMEHEKTFKIMKIHSSLENQEIHNRLLDLGFYEGMTLKILRRISFGGPWVVQADNLYLALRDEEFKLLDLR